MVDDANMDASNTALSAASEEIKRNADIIRGSSEYQDYINKWKTVFGGKSKIMGF